MKSQMTPEQQEIHAVHSIWIDAVNAGDLALLLTLITDDLVLFSPGQEPFGQEVFSKVFSTAHQDLRIDCASDLEEVVVVGEVAYTRSRDTVSVTPHAGGETAWHAGHRITIYRRQPDGRWLLARDAHTLVPEAAEIQLLRKTYAAFNAREIDAALTFMTPEVAWPRAFKGGFVRGPEAIREYWTEQWGEIDPIVNPVSFHPESAGNIRVEVHQVVRDLTGTVLADLTVGHRFIFADGLIDRMEVCEFP